MDDENKILALISKLDFTKAVYNEYGVKMGKSGKKCAFTAVFSFKNVTTDGTFNFENLTIEVYVGNIGDPYITKINNMTVSINLGACDYYDMEAAALHGTRTKAIKIIEDYLKS